MQGIFAVEKHAVRPEQAQNLVEYAVGRKHILPQKPRHHARDHAGKIIDHAEHAHALVRKVDQRRQKVTGHQNDRNADKRIEHRVAQNLPEYGIDRKHIAEVPQPDGIIEQRARVREKRPDQRLHHRVQRKDRQPDDQGRDKHPALTVFLPDLFKFLAARRRFFRRAAAFLFLLNIRRCC